MSEPTINELVEAVREFLAEEVMPGTDGRLSFQARVARNVLATVERELELGPDQDLAHAGRLAALGVADDAELAAAIRRGDMDERWDEVRAAVAERVEDRLRIANPRWLV